LERPADPPNVGRTIYRNRPRISRSLDTVRGRFGVSADPFQGPQSLLVGAGIEEAAGRSVMRFKADLTDQFRNADN
jgi:hypothetical protein